MGRVVVVAGVAVALLAGAVITFGLAGRSAAPRSGALAAGARRVASSPVVVVQRETARGVAWSQPMTVTVSGGRLRGLAATSADGPLVGTLSPSGWTSKGRLLPSTSYSLVADVVDDNGTTSITRRTVRTRPADAVLNATLSPDSSVVGIGAPVIVTFDHAVTGHAARAAVLSRLRVSSLPRVTGAWRWMDSYEVHYRGAAYWAAGTKVTVTSDLHGLNLPGTGTWGTDTQRTASFRVGDAVVSTVDVTAHTMTVVRNGTVLKTVKVSTGRAKYPTKGGVHLVLLKERQHLYDSSTVGIPVKSADGYYETLPWSVRISNGGAFVHANPATVADQGHLNVSHGCVNLSVPDAQWFFGIAKRGDVVNVVHAAVGPVLSDAGMEDWNMSFATWRQGNL